MTTNSKVKRILICGISLMMLLGIDLEAGSIRLPRVQKKRQVSTDVKGAAAMSQKQVRTAFFTLPPPVQLRGCAWNWPYTNALNGYFRIEATTNLASPTWMTVTNTLWLHYVEQPIQQHYFRGWYMHNLYGMIPIRTGN